MSKSLNQKSPVTELKDTPESKQTSSKDSLKDTGKRPREITTQVASPGRSAPEIPCSPRVCFQHRGDGFDLKGEK